MPSSAITVACARARRRAAASASLLVLVSALAAEPPSALGKVYFSAFPAAGGTGIERAGFDGGGLETLQFEPAGFEDDLALDATDGKMYWTDTDASVIASSNMNGADVQIVLDDFGAEPLGIALDVPDGKMYWTDRAGVKRANLDGTEAELLTREPARGFIALDLASHQMYWADWPSGDVKSAAMAPGAAVANIVTKQPTPFGIALDEAAGEVYWLDLDLERKKHEQDEIRTATLTGAEARTLLARPGAGFEGGLAVEPAAGKIYWTEAGARDIGVANLDGSQAQTLFSTGEDVPEGLAVESAEPRPTDSVAPSIEGSAQVGEPLFCNPGTWSGAGPISFVYQWVIAGAGAIEGATSSIYVPSIEQAGVMLQCAVTATDDVETGSATSAPIELAGLPIAPAFPSPASVAESPQAQLHAGIALSSLTSSGTTARVPVFASLAITATLAARPAGMGRGGHGGGGARHAPALEHSAATRASKVHARREPRKRDELPRTITVHRALAAGRGTITLVGLVPGITYRLLLAVQSADGQRADDAATLRVLRASRKR